MIKTERTIWIAYHQDKGFIQGKAYKSYTDDFTKARVYNQKNHLSSSVGCSEEIIPVPLKVMIDPEVLVILRLGGKPVTDT